MAVARELARIVAASQGSGVLAAGDYNLTPATSFQISSRA